MFSVIRASGFSNCSSLELSPDGSREKVTESDHDILTNILIGIAGAFVGGKLAEVLQIPVVGFFRTLIAASIGAVILLWVWRKIHANRMS